MIQNGDTAAEQGAQRGTPRPAEEIGPSAYSPSRAGEDPDMRPTQRSKQGWQVVFTRNRAWIAKIHAMLERNDALLQSNGALTAPDHVGAREPGTAATSERDLPPHVDEPNRRAILATAVALRRRLADQALALARTEDEIARHQEALAAQHPHHADRYRQAAEDARQGARQARQAAQRFRD